MPDAPALVLWRETRLPYLAPADAPLMLLYVSANEKHGLRRDARGLPVMLDGCVLQREDREERTYLRLMCPPERHEAMRKAWREGCARGARDLMAQKADATVAEMNAAAEKAGLAAQRDYRDKWLAESNAREQKENARG